MSIIVAGHWEIGYNTPIIEANYWNLVLRDFEVNDWRMVPISGIKHNETQLINLSEYSSYDEMLDSCDDHIRVFLEPRTNHQNPDTIWLDEFTHPEKCVYVFGSAHYNPTLKHKREQDQVVTIRTVQNKGVLWSHQCLPILLHDRLIKQWQ